MQLQVNCTMLRKRITADKSESSSVIMYSTTNVTTAGSSPKNGGKRKGIYNLNKSLGEACFKSLWILYWGKEESTIITLWNGSFRSNSATHGCISLILNHVPPKWQHLTYTGYSSTDSSTLGRLLSHYWAAQWWKIHCVSVLDNPYTMKKGLLVNEKR